MFCLPPFEELFEPAPCDHKRITALWGPDADILYPTCWKCLDCGDVVNSQREPICP
jgi:hypothetical protein